jgi:sterol desaturase/sphingolipid hydroxylase (fatty acid hydroxylase superfamily)
MENVGTVWKPWPLRRWRLIFPSSTVSSSPTRTWLHLGFRLGLMGTGLTIVIGVRSWWSWIPISIAVVIVVVDAVLEHRVRRAHHPHQTP